ncbi:hypothetical protein LguiA_033889 [Lonicera macranthoides]
MNLLNSSLVCSNVILFTSTKLSLLEAFFNNVGGIYTTDLPDQPPVIFDDTNPNNSFNSALLMTNKSTSVKKVKYNSTGFGNYDPVNRPKTFNLVNPQERNTIGVPVGGWAVVRFRANNPGVWLIHCHLAVHLPWGLATAFVVENWTDAIVYSASNSPRSTQVLLWLKS